MFWVKFDYRTLREWGEGEGEEPATPIHIDLLISFAGLQWFFFFFFNKIGTFSVYKATVHFLIFVV